MKKGLVSFSVEAILADDRGKYKEKTPDEMTVTSSESPVTTVEQREKDNKVIKQERNDDHPDSTVQDEEKLEVGGAQQMFLTLQIYF